ncbi:hypothetical protein [Sanguibacteroides justesenii]|nr:hypothetical protein [Sanguibacteroides justesenii]
MKKKINENFLGIFLLSGRAYPGGVSVCGSFAFRGSCISKHKRIRRRG